MLDDFEFNPMVLVTGAVGFLLGVIMLKFGGLQGMGLLGTLGLIVGSTIGGIVAGLIWFRD